jgi:hypothetical protein
MGERVFEIFCDHRPLQFLHTQRHLNPMLCNWYREIFEYNFKMTYRPGYAMACPDALSRILRDHTTVDLQPLKPVPLADKAQWVQRRTARAVKHSQQLTADDLGIDPEGHQDYLAPRVSRQNLRVHLSQLHQKTLFVDHTWSDPDHCESPAVLEGEMKDVMLDNGLDDSCSEEGESVGYDTAAQVYVTAMTEWASRPEKELQEFVDERLGKDCPPFAERKHIIKAEHERCAHNGGMSLFRSIWMSNRWWPGMMSQCRSAVKECLVCQKWNVSQAGYHPLRTIRATDSGDCLSIDSAGPFPPSEDGDTHVLVACDKATKFRVFLPMKGCDSVSVAKALWTIFAFIGVPKAIISDNGTEYCNAVINSLAEAGGIDKRTINSYSPSQNGEAESSVRVLKLALEKMIGDRVGNWVSLLPVIQTFVNRRCNSRSKSSPFTLMLNRPMNGFKDFADYEQDGVVDIDKLVGHIEQFNTEYKQHYLPALQVMMDGNDKKLRDATDGRRKIVPSYRQGDVVLIKNLDTFRKFGDPQYEGPFLVMSKQKGNSYKLKHRESKTVYGRNVTINELKRYQAGDEQDMSELGNDGDDMWEVDAILDHDGPVVSRRYLIKWKYHSHAHNSWESEADTDTAAALKRAYWRSNTRFQKIDRASNANPIFQIKDGMRARKRK